MTHCQHGKLFGVGCSECEYRLILEKMREAWAASDYRDAALAFHEAEALAQGDESQRRSRMDKRTKGLYGKFEVRRMDGQSDLGTKHQDCRYFVLDLDHDKFAAPALKAYADACREEYPALARDLDRGDWTKITPHEESPEEPNRG